MPGDGHCDYIPHWIDPEALNLHGDDFSDEPGSPEGHDSVFGATFDADSGSSDDEPIPGLGLHTNSFFDTSSTGTIPEVAPTDANPPAYSAYDARRTHEARVYAGTTAATDSETINPGLVDIFNHNNPRVPLLNAPFVAAVLQSLFPDQATYNLVHNMLFFAVAHHVASPVDIVMTPTGWAISPSIANNLWAALTRIAEVLACAFNDHDPWRARGTRQLPFDISDAALAQFGPVMPSIFLALGYSGRGLRDRRFDTVQEGIRAINAGVYAINYHTLFYAWVVIRFFDMGIVESAVNPAAYFPMNAVEFADRNRLFQATHRASIEMIIEDPVLRNAVAFGLVQLFTYGERMIIRTSRGGASALSVWPSLEPRFRERGDMILNVLVWVRTGANSDEPLRRAINANRPIHSSLDSDEEDEMSDLESVF
ncbi:hypothetical protein HMN09_00548400 [Mycena chlorophos]|uniref:Uncharacterized protein n=1 Tax=Mycena chlorophos TaxID=658473 RepID=A0A8H6T8M8_MYCCL|nr:hypothetical protein HMN09_00548400 [Mycena chlorophos]